MFEKIFINVSEIFQKVPLNSLFRMKKKFYLICF